MNLDMSNSAVELKEFETPTAFFVEPVPGNIPSASGSFVVTQDGASVQSEWDQESVQSNKLSILLTAGMLEYAQTDVLRFPGSAKAHLNLGLAYAADGQFDVAVESFAKALEINNASYSALTHLVRAEIQLESLDAAERHCIWGLERYPRDSALMISLSTVHIHRGANDQALKILQEALIESPKDPAVQYALGVLYLSIGDFRNSLGLMKKVSKVMERSPQTFQALGVAYALSGQAKASVKAFQTAIELDRSSVASLRGLAQILVTTGQYDRVAKLLTHYVETQDDHQAKDILAHALFKLGKPAASRRLYQELLSLELHSECPDACRLSQLKNDIGCCYAKENNSARATHFFREAINDCEARGHLPFQNLAGQLLRQGQTTEAKELLLRALMIFPQEPFLYLLLASVEERNDNPRRAIDVLQSGMNLPGAPWEIFAQLGWLLSDFVRDLEGAQRVLEKGLARFPHQPGLINNLAYVHLLKEDIGAAERLISRIPAASDDVFLTATSGLLELKRGLIAKSRSLYERAAFIASTAGNRSLAHAVKQKMHLEFAKYFTSILDFEKAKSEVHAGLMIKDGRLYSERELLHLNKLIGLS